MKLQSIERRSGLTPEQFKREHLDTLTPVVLSDFMDSWDAKDKWTLDFFKNEYGDMKVPVFTNNFSAPGKAYRSAEVQIPFREYLEKIETGPTDYRLFLFNILQRRPELTSDYGHPEIMDGFIDKLPFMFFGGEGSKVDLHFDSDLSHVFLSQFHGRKKVLLFSPDQSRNLYQHPFTVASEVDLDNPNYEKFPALHKLEGFECVIYPGDTVFIPSGYWHYITYMDGGFSMSQRARASWGRFLMGMSNVARHFVVDKSMNKLLGQRWRDYKIKKAHERAGNAVPA